MAGPPCSVHASRVARAEAWVRGKIAGHDSSHDFWHVRRVTDTAVALAQEEGLSAHEAQLAELAALLHDVADHKYCADGGAAERAALGAFVGGELALPDEDGATVLWVIDTMGFKEELGRAQQQGGEQAQGGQQQQAQQQGEQQAEPPAEQQQRERSRQRVRAVVQDADRLDAIGAIGIARCLTFGGRFNRVLHDPSLPPRDSLTTEQYSDKAAASRSTTLHHFPEKLLKLKGLMRTAAGRRRAEGRHDFMQAFLDQFHAEWRADA